MSKSKEKKWLLPSEREIQSCIDNANLDLTIRWEWYYHPVYSLICVINRDNKKKGFENQCVSLQLDTAFPNFNNVKANLEKIIKENTKK